MYHEFLPGNITKLFDLYPDSVLVEVPNIKQLWHDHSERNGAPALIRERPGVLSSTLLELEGDLIPFLKGVVVTHGKISFAKGR